MGPILRCTRGRSLRGDLSETDLAVCRLDEDPDGGSSTGEVASRLGVRAKATSQARHALIGKGIVFSPQRGRIAFAVPNMCELVRRQPDLDLDD